MSSEEKEPEPVPPKKGKMKKSRSRPGKREPPPMKEPLEPKIGHYKPLIDSPAVFKENRPNVIEITFKQADALIEQIMNHIMSIPDYAVNPAAQASIEDALRIQLRILLAKKLLISADRNDKASLGAVYSAISSQEFLVPVPIFIYADMFGSFQTVTDHFRVLNTPDWIYTLLDFETYPSDTTFENLNLIKYTDHDVSFDMTVRGCVHDLIKIRLKDHDIYVNSSLTTLDAATIALLRADDRPVAEVLEVLRNNPDAVLTAAQRSALHMHVNDGPPQAPQAPNAIAQIQSRVKRYTGEMNNSSSAALTLLLPRISTMDAKLASDKGSAAQLVTDHNEYFARAEGQLPSGVDQALGRMLEPTFKIYRFSGTGVISSGVNVDSERARFVMETVSK